MQQLGVAHVHNNSSMYYVTQEQQKAYLHCTVSAYMVSIIYLLLKDLTWAVLSACGIISEILALIFQNAI